ncbi:MAG: ribonuclease III [Candidatus Omnitrophota bacterium]|jgi:ribonuclease-3|nr:MAG: ribonuclease III [Candidatus Omnitrophota bacterium]
MTNNFLFQNEERYQAIEELAKRLGIPEIDLDLLNLSLCHSSYANEQENFANFGNERLEFLGDAIVGFAVTEALYLDYPDLREGRLSKVKSIVVSKRILAQRTISLGLGDYLLLGKGEEQTGGRTRFSILGNLFESVVGAIHLSCGIEASKRFVLDELDEEIEKAVRGESIIDYKSKLQEQIQKDYGVLPAYKLVSAIGPDHDKEFVVEVYVRERQIGVGNGKSKKRAEKAAAANALSVLANEEQSADHE